MILCVNKKPTWKNIPMGAQNAAPLFGDTVTIIQSKCQEEVNRKGISETGLEVIIEKLWSYKLIGGGDGGANLLQMQYRYEKYPLSRDLTGFCGYWHEKWRKHPRKIQASIISETGGIKNILGPENGYQNVQFLYPLDILLWSEDPGFCTLFMKGSSEGFS